MDSTPVTRGPASSASRFLVLGGDGFCGWPTTLHLSSQGHEVAVVDNGVRRRIDDELGSSSLTPINTLDDRVSTWRRESGCSVDVHRIDIARDYDALVHIIESFRPDHVIHFAEQRAVPYAALSAKHARYTVNNNVVATHNVLSAIKECDASIHLIHLGSAGVYGYTDKGWVIPEGYLDARVVTGSGSLVSAKLRQPMEPGSVYHTTKAIDNTLFEYYCAYEGLRVTDLHQGVVWGSQTDITESIPGAINRYDYDTVYGTVVNRFLLQATLGQPLTVFGSGDQSRAFIHLRDVLRCLDLVADNPAGSGELRIRNQLAESFTIEHVATEVANVLGATIQHLPNPREEEEQAGFEPTNESFISLGLTPQLLATAIERESTTVVARFADRADLNVLDPATASSSHSGR